MGKKYSWVKKELYRMPFQVGLRFYGVKKCAKWSDKGYFLGSHRKSFDQLKTMTVDVDYRVELNQHKDCPF